MCLKKTVIIIAFFAATNAAIIQPTDLIDVVTEQLEELKKLVSDEILSAHNSIESLVTEFEETCTTAINYGTTSMQQESDRIHERVQDAVSKAEAEGKDPSQCTNYCEESFVNLTSEYTENIKNCVDDVRKKANTTAEDSKYIIDITINTVNHLESQIGQCQEDNACLSSLLGEIKSNQGKLPAEIKGQLQQLQGNFNGMKTEANSCPNGQLTGYARGAEAILTTLQSCINNLLI